MKKLKKNYVIVEDMATFMVRVKVIEIEVGKKKVRRKTWAHLTEKETTNPTVSKTPIVTCLSIVINVTLTTTRIETIVTVIGKIEIDSETIGVIGAETETVIVTGKIEIDSRTIVETEITKIAEMIGEGMGTTNNLHGVEVDGDNGWLSFIKWGR